MSVIECGTIEEPENVLKALVNDNTDEVLRLLQELGEEAYYWFTLTDVSGYDPQRYYEIYSNPEIKCRFNIVAMALVFGSETMVRTVLDNVSKNCMTTRCRMYFLDQNHQYMDMMVEYEAPFVFTKASLFHNPNKFWLLELMRREYGFDLSIASRVSADYIDDVELLDLKAEDPYPALLENGYLPFPLEPPITYFHRRRSLLAAIAHELPLDVLDKYCKLYPHTLLPDGCFHLGRCLKVGDFDRLRVLFNNGLHHRPEYAKKKWLVESVYSIFPKYEIVKYTDEGKHQLCKGDLLHLITEQSYRLEDPLHAYQRITSSQLKLFFAWLAAFQYSGAYEFEYVPDQSALADLPDLQRSKVMGFIPLAKRAFEEWNNLNRPKSLYCLCRSLIRTSIPMMNGEFENSIREMIGCRPIEEGVGCNFHRLNEYFAVVTGPPVLESDNDQDGQE